MTGPDRQAADAARRWLALARQGEFRAAWEVSDRIRAATPVFGDASRPRHQQVLWNGSPVSGRHVLVRCYHGLGDTIQFARYLPQLRARAARVTVWAQDALLPLLQTMPVDVHWLPLHDGDPGVAADVDVEIMELAHVFRSTVDTIPNAVPYLHVAPLPVPASPRPRIGVIWRAGEWDRERSLPFSALTPLLDDERLEWYSLQHRPDSRERHPRLRCLSVADLVSTARMMRALDVVMTVDTMGAHLAGALGVTTWTLLRRHADWRWLEARDDSPWYPTMHLFRQRVEGQWDAVLAEVQAALQPSARNRSSG